MNTRIHPEEKQARPASRWVCVRLAFGGLFVCGGAVGLALLSRRFVWGEGHDGRPIEQVVAALLIVGAGCALGTPGSGRLRGARSLAWIVGVGLFARLVLLPSCLIQESDCYRYVLDGAAVCHGVNPFRYSPERVREAVDAVASPGFAASVKLPAAGHIICRINYPELRTIYPPLAQTAFAAGFALTPWDWRGQRIVFLLFDLATLALLAWGLRRRGAPVTWLVFWAWNPLIIKEIANAAHLDSLVAFWILALCLTLALSVERPTMRLTVVVSALFAAAVLAKIYPLLLGPLCAGALARGRGGWRRLGVFCVVSGAVMAMGTAPFFSVGFESLTEGLRAYSSEWVRNAGAYALLARVVPAPRFVSGALVAMVSLLCAVHVWRVGSAASVVDAFQVALGVWFLMLPAAFPWYAVGLLAVCALRPRAWALTLSASFALYYLLFLYEYRNYSDQWRLWTQAIEHGVVWGVIVAGGCRWLWRWRRADTTAPEPEDSGA